MDNYLTDIAKDFNWRNFKGFKDIYYVTQLEKLDKNKLYRIFFPHSKNNKGYFMFNDNYYEESANLNASIKLHKVSVATIKQELANDTGRLSVYQEKDTAVVSSLNEDFDEILEASDDYTRGHTDGYREGYKDGYGVGRSDTTGIV